MIDPHNIPPIFQGISLQLLSDWKSYHSQNRQVWVEFERMSLELISKGRTKYSPWAIIGAIRYNTDIRQTEPFKINNDYIALYARNFIYHHPDHKDFFELRKMKAKGRKKSEEQIERETTTLF